MDKILKRMKKSELPIFYMINMKNRIGFLNVKNLANLINNMKLFDMHRLDRDVFIKSSWCCIVAKSI